MSLSRRFDVGLIVLLLLMGIGIRLYLYHVGSLSIPVTTDEALTVLQAEEVLAGEWPLLLSAQPYMFPLEAYWMAPMVKWLPRTAHGMRVLVMMEGAIYTWLALLLLHGMVGKEKSWRRMGWLLILFPPVYLLMNQTAYSQPHNNSAFILVLAGAWFVQRLEQPPVLTRWRACLLAALGGFFGVLAFSNAILSIALVAPLALVAVWNSVGRDRWLRLPAYVFGGTIGIIPYVAAILLHPGAHQSVTATHAWGKAIGRIWNPGIVYTLPITFGWTPCLFPDSSERLMHWGSWGRLAFPWVFGLLLLTAVVLAAWRVVHHALQRNPVRLGLAEWSVGVTILCLLLFGMSKRADSSAYRYLVPVVVAFPYLVVLLVKRLRGWTAGVAAVLLVGLSGYHLVTAIRLPEAWKAPDFARDIVSAPDLQPAFDVLNQLDIRHAVASHWAAYRIGFLGNGRVICSQPQNERFPGWPIPYKAEVDAADRIAYVLTEHIRFLKPSVFERHLRTMGVMADVFEAGEFKVYAGFRSPRFEQRQPVAITNVLVTGEAGNAEQVSLMLDNHPETYWRSVPLQTPGMGLMFVFERPIKQGELQLRYGRYSHDAVPVKQVDVLYDGAWHVLVPDHRITWDKFAWQNGNPVYGVAQERISIDQPAEAVRLTVVEPRATMCWTLTDVRLFDLERVNESAAFVE